MFSLCILNGFIDVEIREVQHNSLEYQKVIRLHIAVDWFGETRYLDIINANVCE